MTMIFHCGAYDREYKRGEDYLHALSTLPACQQGKAIKGVFGGPGCRQSKLTMSNVPDE